MEARSFFENSPMAEITVSASKEDWAQVLAVLEDQDDYEKLLPAARLLRAHLYSLGVHE